MKIILSIVIFTVLVLNLVELNEIRIRPDNVTLGEIPIELIRTTTKDKILYDLVKIESKYTHYVKIENFNDLDKNNTEYLLSLDMNPLINAVHLAYTHHLPLTLSPDMIWYLIINGISTHINLQSEELRKNFVYHEGKKKLTVRRDNFLFNSTNNRWSEIIDEFNVKINENTKLNVSELFNSNFTTTTTESLIASKIVLMDAMQKYFQYEFVTLCGIPEFRITGTKEDWVQIKTKLNDFKLIIDDLSNWLNSLDDIIQKFIDIYDEKTDMAFWNQIYKVRGGSGGPYLSGWIINFYPYLKDNVKNYYIWEKSWLYAYTNTEFGGLTTDDFTVTVNKVPFKWNYHDEEYDMLFIGGIFSIKYNTVDKNLTPLFGYAICEDKISEKNVTVL